MDAGGRTAPPPSGRVEVIASEDASYGWDSSSSSSVCLACLERDWRAFSRAGLVPNRKSSVLTVLGEEVARFLLEGCSPFLEGTDDDVVEDDVDLRFPRGNAVG